MDGLGIIVRADCGGLGNQTWEAWRHLEPERTLVIRTAKAGRRGPEDASRYGVTSWYGQDTRVDPRVLKDFASGCSVVLAIETTSCPHGIHILREAGVRTVLLANPELYRESEQGRPDVLRVPTPWAMSRMHGARVLPQPVATDRFTPRPRTAARIFYHPGAPAFHDRNGTEDVLAALPYVKNECTMIIRQPHVRKRSSRRQVGKVTVLFEHEYARAYWHAHPEEADVLVMPRRYGGLCLPVLEAAAMGMPALMTDLTPQNEWPHVVGIPVAQEKLVSMKGGAYPVWSVRPQDLAARMDQLIEDDDFVMKRSLQALDWAALNSWDTLLPQWLGTLS